MLIRRGRAVGAAIATVALLGVSSLSHTTGRTVTIAPGDTLSALAARHGVTVAALADANGITDVNRIVAGATLVIPAPAPSSSARPAALTSDPNRQRFEPLFDRWAAAYGMNAALLKGICWMESGWQNHVTSPTGATGIGQLTPAAVADVERWLDVDLDPALPNDNVRVAARYLRWLLDNTGGDERLAVAAYYQGLRSVQTRGVDPAIEQYVAAVIALKSRFA